MNHYRSRVNKELVKRKLQQLEEYLDELERITPNTYDKYIVDQIKKRAIERLLQLCIECISDINSHLLAKTANIVPSDYYSSFIKAGERSIIPFLLAKEMAPCAGLRNKLVHEYGEVDDKRVYKSINLAATIFPKYIKHIKLFIAGKE